MVLWGGYVDAALESGANRPPPLPHQLALFTMRLGGVTRVHSVARGSGARRGEGMDLCQHTSVAGDCIQCRRLHTVPETAMMASQCQRSHGRMFRCGMHALTVCRLQSAQCCGPDAAVPGRIDVIQGWY